MNKTTLKPAEAVSLKDHVQYAPESVVSKTLLSHKGGTITLFAFSAGQGLSEHTAPFDAFVQILEGQAALTIGGREVLASEGQLVLMPGKVPHSLRAEKPFKMLLTMIHEPS
ncbi:MAG: cupin domain-containing protein [Nitrospinae bacterium]|nr:cupin domain-containing protein [Nitrospinota bacterium]